MKNIAGGADDYLFGVQKIIKFKKKSETIYYLL
jgi:hypothetical protein